MPEYSLYIIAAYGISMLLGITITAVSWHQYRQSQKKLRGQKKLRENNKNHAEK